MLISETHELGVASIPIEESVLHRRSMEGEANNLVVINTLGRVVANHDPKGEEGASAASFKLDKRESNLR